MKKKACCVTPDEIALLPRQAIRKQIFLLSSLLPPEVLRGDAILAQRWKRAAQVAFRAANWRGSTEPDLRLVFLDLIAFYPDHLLSFKEGKNG